MEKRVILMIILIILILVNFFLYITREKNISEFEKQESVNKEDNGESELTSKKVLSEEGSEAENEGVSEGSRGSGGVEGSEAAKQLPSDIETQPCGFYFGEYSVCTGTCPSGSCTQEGRSCYCKEV